MLWIAVVAFALAALGGTTMFFLRMRQKVLPMPIAILHGFGAVAGVVCLVAAVLAGAPRFATYALIGFAVAAVGGSYLFSLHLRGRVLPVPIIMVHGALAVASFVLLVVAARTP